MRVTDGEGQRAVCQGDDVYRDKIMAILYMSGILQPGCTDLLLSFNSCVCLMHDSEYIW